MKRSYLIFNFLILLFSCRPLDAQEPILRRQFFAPTAQQGILKQSEDGKFLRSRIEYFDEYWNLMGFTDTFWEVATRCKLSVQQSPESFEPHQKRLDAEDGFYCVRDETTKKCVRLQYPKANVYFPAHVFSHDETRLLMVNQGLITIWDTNSGQQLHQVRYDSSDNFENGVGPTISSDLTRVVAIDRRDVNSAFRLNVIDVQNGKPVAMLPKDTYTNVLFSPAGTIVRTIDETVIPKDEKSINKNLLYSWGEQTMRFFDSETGKLLWQIEGKQMTRFGEFSNTFSDKGQFSPDGSLYGLVNDKGLAIYESSTGRLLRVLPKEKVAPVTNDQFRSWTFSFDNQKIWAQDPDKLIWCWPLF